MEFVTYSHRKAETLFQFDATYVTLYQEVDHALTSISDDEIVAEYDAIERGSKKSLSEPINHLIKERLVSLQWAPESPIFNDPAYSGTKWRLDFAKQEISIEVAFNHGEAIAWNLLKPMLASEMNHVGKAIQTSAGIIITATQELKAMGNFDGSVGTFEKFQRYLIPMYDLLPSPLLLIGLKAPKTFYIDRKTRQVVYRT